jgi:XTP/dITP diphosphohydrolase
MTERIFTDDTLVIATHNAGKLREINALFGDYPFSVVAAGDLGLAEPEETENSFAGNALLKARAASLASGKPAIADDSGLCVAALDGAPGVYSARWAGPERDFGLAMGAVEHELIKIGSDDRTCCFKCALAIVWPDGVHFVVEGQVNGQLVFPPRGNRGFGYDPIFQPNGYDMSFAQMEPKTKHAISHRANAFQKLIARCFRRPDAV